MKLGRKDDLMWSQQTNSFAHVRCSGMFTSKYLEEIARDTIDTGCAGCRWVKITKHTRLYVNIVSDYCGVGSTSIV